LFPVSFGPPCLLTSPGTFCRGPYVGASQHGVVLERADLPKPLRPHRAKLFGLTTDPFCLYQIRTARKPGSRYASSDQCRREVARAEALFRAHGLPYLDTTHASVEEIATAILQRLGLLPGFG